MDKAHVLEREKIQGESSPIQIVELNELHTYIQSKKTTIVYVWLLIGMKEDMLILCLVRGEQKQVVSYGRN